VSKKISLQLSSHEREGLYLVFLDETRLDFTRQNIEKITEEFWKDPSKISPKTKKEIDFQRCQFCPLKEKGDFCDALRPIIPFLELVDKYTSIDEVVAIYKDRQEIYHISDTTMQEALKYVSILSLTQYCQAGHKYWKYYSGITPLMDPKNMAYRLYLNIYWLHRGNQEEVNSVAYKFTEEIRITSSNQVKRLSMICKNDAFLNAFVNTQLATEFLSMDIEKNLAKSFEDFEKNQF